MLAQFLQFLFSGLTVGSTYALAALGFTMIYNASQVINFAQGEFIMLGGMLTTALAAAGLPLPAAAALAIAGTVAAGMLIERLAIEPARESGVVALIIITIGASLVIRGVVQVALGKGAHLLPAFSSAGPIAVGGASLLPQSLWALAATAVIVLALWLFFRFSLAGKAMLACADNPLAAQLVGINTRRVLLASFGLSAALGAAGGILVAPITMTSYDIGILLGVKGFVAAVAGGLGSGLGAVLGGLLLGVVEAMAAGYVSSTYKDAVPFLLVFVILFLLPRGLLGARLGERV